MPGTLTPYYEEEFGMIYHGDCRDVLPYIGAMGFGPLIVTDPPYGQTSLEWDRWVSGWPQLLAELSVFSMWVFGSLRMFMEHAAEFSDADWRMSQDIVWQKHNGSSFHADRFRRVHEQAVHFYRGPWESIYKKPITTPDATRRAVRRKERPPHMGSIERSSYVSVDGGPRLQRSVIEVRSEHGSAVHPTQKPVGIVRPLIEYACDDFVVDPFMGSGTTLIAARELGRKSIGIEIEERYCEIAAKRLSQGVLPIFGGEGNAHA